MISTRVDTREAESYLRALAGDQFPFALSKALNDAAFQARGVHQDEIKRVFDRPTPFTVRGVLYTKSTKRKLVSKTFLRDEGVIYPAGPAAYLHPNITGGERPQKRFERRLSTQNILPKGWVTVPGTAERLNQYGNLTRGRITQILGDVNAFSEEGFNKATPGARGMFVVRAGSRGRLAPGVWLRQRKKVRPVMLFVPHARYRPQYDFEGVSDQFNKQRFPAIFANAVDYALKTAKDKAK